MMSAGVPLVRRLWPRRVRTRLAVTYAVLFVLAGAVLLALIYALLVTVLVPAPAAPSKQLSPRTAQLLALCKPAPTSPSLVAECKRAIASVGGNDPKQRGDILAALRGASVIGLGLLVIVSAGLGWLSEPVLVTMVTARVCRKKPLKNPPARPVTVWPIAPKPCSWAAVAARWPPTTPAMI